VHSKELGDFRNGFKVLEPPERVRSKQNAHLRTYLRWVYLSQ